jgi:predicted RecB family nuclease
MLENPPPIPTATPGPQPALSPSNAGDSPERVLNKRQFLAGLQCHKQLWWRVHDSGAEELRPDSNSRALMEAGRQIGLLAREYVPGGQLIDFRYQGRASRMAGTAVAMGSEVPALYEGTFTGDGLVIYADILERGSDGWTLVEVKSSLEVRPGHITDAAIQAHVLRSSGIDIRRVEVMHLNRDCRHPDLSNLFRRQDVTEQVVELEASFGGIALAQLAMLQGPLPERATGDHCSSPNKCPFWARCWPELPAHHLSTLHGARKKKVQEWDAQGWQTISQLPEDVELKGISRRQVSAVRASRMVIENGLAKALEAFKPPLAFLDFEAVQPAIPRWPGCGPYTHIPVQLSCHTLAAGRYGHLEWLADGPGDPRPEFARRLLAACGGSGSIIVYNSSYEAGCIRHLSAAVPELEHDLSNLRDRLVDLLPVLSAFVYDPAFGGSFSLKSVVPVMAPEVRYGGMAISEGRTASNELMRLLFDGGLDPQERSILREQLLAYCKVDTWAMVRLFERLGQLARGSTE